MTYQDLKAKYGGTKTRQIINRAIRAEFPDGGKLLDALLAAYTSRDKTALKTIGRQLDELEAEIRARYGVQQNPDLRRVK